MYEQQYTARSRGTNNRFRVPNVGDENLLRGRLSSPRRPGRPPPHPWKPSLARSRARRSPNAWAPRVTGTARGLYYFYYLDTQPPPVPRPSHPKPAVQLLSCGRLPAAVWQARVLLLNEKNYHLFFLNIYTYYKF